MGTEDQPPSPSSQFHSFNRRCCFCIPYKWQKINTSSPSSPNFTNSDNTLWSRGITALKKLREWSEIVAGPKWKTFIRRFNRNKSSGQNKFQYDPIDYALNFDEGVMENGGEEMENEYMIRNFSSRYALRTPPSIGSKTTSIGSKTTSFDQHQGKDSIGPNFV